MPKVTEPWRYNVTYGLPGCLPDSYYGPFMGTTRKELIAMVRDAIDFYQLPKSAIKQCRFRRIWPYIRRHGSSTAHFDIRYKQFILEFEGLTEEEFERIEREMER